MRYSFTLLLAGAFAAVALAAGCSGGSGSAPSLANSDAGPGRGSVHVMSSPTNPETVHLTGTGYFDSSGNYYEDGYEFPVEYKPAPQQSWVLTPWLSPSQTYLGYSALGYQLNASGPSPSPLPTDYENDKANNKLTEFDFDTNVWEGFAFELPSTKVPGVDVILAQWWQGSPFSPPVSLVLKANDNYECYVVIRNNKSGGNPDTTKATWLDIGQCTPGSANGGTWHTFVIHIYADTSSNGEVQAWLDTPLSDAPTKQVSSINVGYVPGQCVQVNGDEGCEDPSPSPAPTAASKFATYIGPYRPSDENEVKVFFANVKFAYSEASADPTQP
jgi:hypothetical protein